MSTSKNTLSVAEAKSWVLQQATSYSGSDGLTKKTKIRNIKPLWEKAFKTEDEHYYVVQVPLESQEFSFRIKPTSSNNTFGTSKLLVLEDKKTGLKLSVLMHIFSDDEVIQNFEYGKPPSNFNGTIFYTDVEGNFLLGWRFSNGKVVRKSTKSTDADCLTCLADPDHPGGETQQCITYATDWYERECEQVIYSGEIRCGQWIYIGTTYERYCTTTSGGGGNYQPSPAQPKDCAGVEGGSAYIGECGICVGGNTGLLSCNDPCAMRLFLNTQSVNTNIATQLYDIATLTINSVTSTDPNGKEYGGERNLISLTGSDYKSIAARTQDNASLFTPNFTWNSVDGYTIGVAHGHPQNSGPSPADVFWPLGNLTNADLQASGKVDFYRSNFTTITTTSNFTYAVVIHNWDALASLKNTYNNNPAAFNATYREWAEGYGSNIDPYSDAGTRSAYALLKMFGSAITVLRTPTGSYSSYFQPLTLHSLGNVINSPCPEIKNELQ